MFNKLLLLLLIWAGAYYYPYAQSNAKFDHLTTEDGLLDMFNFAIFQDKDGFVWIGGKAGLQRYDGYSFMNYTYSKEHFKVGVNEMTIRHIMQTRDGAIWVGTGGGGAFRLEDGAINFTISFDPNKELSLPGNFVEDIVQDDQSDGLWIATNQGLVFYDHESVSVFKHDPNNPFSLSDNRIFSLLMSNEGDLWVGTQNGLNKHLGGGRFQRFISDPSDPGTISGNFIHDIFQDRNGALWLAIILKGIDKLDPSTGKVNRYQPNQNDPNSISGNIALNIAEDLEGNIWVATYGDGLNKMEEDGVFQVFRNDPLDQTSIQNDNLEEVMVDKSGNVWTVNSLGGANRYSEGTITAFPYNKFQEEGMIPVSTVQALTIAKDGTIWFGTSAGALGTFKDGSFSSYDVDSGDGRGVSSLRIGDIIEDRDGDIWISTVGAGVDYYRNGVFTHFVVDSEDLNGVHDIEIPSMIEDQQGQIWMGGARNGIAIYNKPTESFKYLRKDPNRENSLIDDNINDLCLRKDGSILIATENGLDIFKDENFSHFQNESGVLGSLPKNHVTRVIEDDEENVWVSFDGGIARLDETNGKFEVFGKDKGFVGLIIEDMVLDARGNLWIASHDGAARFNYGSELFESFGKKQGFISNSILRINSAEDKIYFMAGEGFYMADLDALKINANSTSLRISDFRLSGDLADSIQSNIRTSFNKGEDISLSHTQNSFEIDYTPLSDEINPAFTYSYRLVGLEDKWNTTQNHGVSYSYLNPGYYEFQVQITSDEENRTAVLPIEIRPAWWQTLLFKLFVLITTVILIILIVRNRIKNTKDQKAMLEQKVDEATSEVKKQNEILLKQSKNLDEAIQETNNVINEAVSSGNLSARIDLKDKEGDWRELGMSINKLFDSIIIPFDVINRVMTKMAQGDLQDRYFEESRGDIKLLSDNLNSTLHTLSTLLENIVESSTTIQKLTSETLATSDEINTTTNEIATVTGEISSGAQQQVSKIDQAFNLMERIQGSSKDNFSLAEDIRKIAGESSQKSQDGIEEIQGLGDVVLKVTEISENAGNAVQDLSTNSEEITNVLNIMKEIANQTNLLALNAAIEAAQAGDSGRGFSVIADEIRKLAENSRNYTSEVENLIGAVQQGTKTTSELVQEMQSSMKIVKSSSDKSKETFSNIVTYCTDTLDLSKSIVTATSSQTENIGEVIKRFEEVTVIAEESATSTEESASSTAQLSAGMNNLVQQNKTVASISSDLLERLKYFKTNTEGGD